MKDASTILYITLGIGGILGGILTAINKFRFVKKDDFKEHIVNCPQTLGTKIDNVNDTVVDLKATVENNAKESQARREDDKQYLTDHLVNIASFVGKVEQYMVDKKL